MDISPPESYAGLELPRTELAIAARRYAEELTDPVVFRHSLRGYLFGRALGEARALRAGADYDDELMFIASVLHDLGVSDEGNADERFEVDGADLAARFLSGHGMPDDRVALVWDAIALHTFGGVGARKGPEVMLCHAGIAADILGKDRGLLPAGFADRVHAELPREDLAYALTDAIVAQCLDNPRKAGPLSFPGQLVRHHLPHGTLPDWYELIAAAGWGDRPTGSGDGPADARSPQELGELFVRHLASGDLDGLTRLYEPRAVFVPRPGDTVTGTHGIRESLRRYTEEGVRITLRLRRIHRTGDLALLSSVATMSAPGTATVTRTTAEVARRQPDGRWLYVVDDPSFDD
ncbi:nuclear transport factor 2 family protein [Streptomyces yaizuensis]|uniref:SgcJ/EcaC family oxidoreductase n=1 Tax=Streptomyces yaizuensis TaxID=2989713 RepID=A0ABQ5NRM8_9ACTN|nr:nuclear transport factor 2 family protein [Streptomyces sp. YSPA8]GLF92825.1 SgcJ/EcaC family oxidoreductase [Streptomyces sp. YSPA8]